MRETNLILLIIVASIALLLCAVSSVSISYEESVVLFKDNSLIHYLVYSSTKLLGNSDLALRLPFIIMHIFSLILIYKISKLILRKKMDRVVSVAIYAMATRSQ